LDFSGGDYDVCFCDSASEILGAVRIILAFLFLNFSSEGYSKTIKSVFFKSISVSLFHFFETILSKTLLTGNINNKIYNGRQLYYAPLLFELNKTLTIYTQRKESIMYFGRIDNEKYFNEFYNLNIEKSIYGTSNLNIKNFKKKISFYSQDEKKNIFNNYKFVWCVQKNDFTQSAVIIDALRYGCCIIISETDSIIHKLNHSCYITVPHNFNVEIIINKINDYHKKFVNGPECNNELMQIAGKIAFEKHWVDHFKL
jgi:hypothetical protein